jgi:hypothetical protein
VVAAGGVAAGVGIAAGPVLGAGSAMEPPEAQAAAPAVTRTVRVLQSGFMRESHRVKGVAARTRK